MHRFSLWATTNSGASCAANSVPQPRHIFWALSSLTCACRCHFIFARWLVFFLIYRKFLTLWSMIYCYTKCIIMAFVQLLINGLLAICQIENSTHLWRMLFQILVMYIMVFRREVFWTLFYFLIYVNDIARALPGEKLKLFADDTNLFISGIDKTAINNKCNECLETLNNWSSANCLCMNSDKTNFMVFLSGKSNGITVLINGHQIAQVHSSKYLDLYNYRWWS